MPFYRDAKFNSLLAAKNRGGLSTLGFAFEEIDPDWKGINEQIARLLPIHGGPPHIDHQDRAIMADKKLWVDGYAQVRQLVKSAIESPTAELLADFLNFATRFRRLAVWNARMAYIQRPGARVIASEFEWQSVGRHVLPDAVPIIILWPFSPIRSVYELEDTGPLINRADIGDPFATEGKFRHGTLTQHIRGRAADRRAESGQVGGYGAAGLGEATRGIRGREDRYQECPAWRQDKGND